MNLPTIIITLILAALFVTIVVAEVRKRKNGKGCSCGGNCGACQGGCSSRDK